MTGDDRRLSPEEIDAIRAIRGRDPAVGKLLGHIGHLEEKQGFFEQYTRHLMRKEENQAILDEQAKWRKRLEA